MTTTQIATAFSNGQFERTYSHLAENVEWDVIEENRFTGKEAVIQNCEEVASYFRSVTTNFKTLNVITENNKVVVNGTAEFIKVNKLVAFVSACDVYEFNNNNQLEKITSYCIQKK